MIDRLRTVMRGAILPSLQGFLTRDSERETSTEGPREQASARDHTRSPEEHVLALLEENGGRMWQQAIIDETGYSEAHVSRVLGRLEDEGSVGRQWNGGEKVVFLDEESPDAVTPELNASS